MRVLLFLNNWGGWQVVRWLRLQPEEIVGLVLQPPDDRRFAGPILSAAKLPPERIWTADQLRDPGTAAQLRALRPDIGVSAFFGFILKPEIIHLSPCGCINLHSAYLPYNRGWHTNVWPILEGSPAGATIHYIDAGVDAGDIIAQRRMAVEPTDTGGSLHRKITTGLVELFKDAWPLIRQGRNARIPQDHSRATVHRKAELAEISHIHLDRPYRAGALIDLLRARTYPPYPSAYFVEGGRRVYVRVQLLREHELASVGETADGGRRPPRIDPGAEMKAGRLLELLGVGASSACGLACLMHDSGPIYVRAYPVDERDISTEASPAWMSGQEFAGADGSEADGMSHARGE